MGLRYLDLEKIRGPRIEMEAKESATIKCCSGHPLFSSFSMKRAIDIIDSYLTSKTIKLVTYFRQRLRCIL